MKEYLNNSSSNEPDVHILLGDVTSRGGIERVSITLANALSALYKVRLVSLYASLSDISFRPVDSIAVTILHNGYEESMYNRSKSFLAGVLFDINYVFKKRKALKKSDLADENAIAICCDVKMTLLAKMAGYKKIITIEHFEYDVINPVLKKIREWLYKKISAVVTLTPEDKDKYNWMPEQKHFVIPNIVEIPRQIVPFQQRANCVLAVGRLTHQKGFDLLLQAWSRIDTADWMLRIIGDGPDKETLQSYIADNRLNNVKILPFNKHIAKEYNQAKIFVLSSRYEGWGMVLVEALAFGMACISFDCPAGPKTILQRNNGILVKAEDVNSLAKEIKKLMENKAMQKELSQKAPESIAMYSEKQILLKWQEVIEQVSK
ncbi:glycosyltransferase family 4 protein [Mixta hanseatica]|uniref:Glycosyltransferase family 4 protein n=1 Tax=Mixta hanseatica TaxID=2872648 RepID=A0ABY4R420_9GAMM|nr:glycosyltransferase family 4 protein [Mixta hanseatica]UQY42861.1 glycosyltransferase family 4 protein [Mixta hanseatica]